MVASEPVAELEMEQAAAVVELVAAAVVEQAAAVVVELVAAVVVAVPAEQLVLVRIHECRAAGLSLRAIAGILMAEGIVTKEGKGTWHASTIKSILTRAAAVAA
jgi:hypothetical protein